MRRPCSAVDAAAILQSLDPAVVARDAAGVVTAWNSGAERLYGYSAKDMAGRMLKAVVPSESRAWELQAFKAALLAGLSDTYRSKRMTKDGVTREVSVQISPIIGSADAIVGVSTIEQETTAEGDGAEAAADAGPSYFASAFEDAPIGMALVGVADDPPGRLMRVNSAFCVLTGYPADKLEATGIEDLLHPDDVATDLAAMHQLSAGELDGFQLEQRLLHSERHAIWVTVNASLVRDSDGAPLYCIRQVQNIEERKRYEGELGYLVEHDPLTGPLNRRGFIRELTHEMAYSRRYGGAGTVLFLDLDDFKSVNDTLGHGVGDEVICEVARLLRERMRETDAVARLGGDEFAVLLPHTLAAEAQMLSTNLIESVSTGHGFPHLGSRPVTLSVGVNGFDRPGDDTTADDVLADADSAMYAAKDAGKNRVAVATAATHDRTQTRITWVERVRRALQEDLFELYCQPIIDFTDDSVSQWELLLRLPGNEGELILPSQFLYTAERSGLILEIDRWVLGEAVGLIAGQRDAGREVRLAVNISGRSVGDADLLSVVHDGLRETAIDPASLVLEVTETAAIANMDRARGFATQLQSLGCRFALDDFGAGFGSFYYLKHIPFDYVKIDGEFIRNLPVSSTDQLILDSIVQMSRGLGKHTIAEFVGDLETVRVLKDHGVDYGQGFHLGKPVPVAEALAA